MRANLDATNTLPMAEHITTLITPTVGKIKAHDLVAQASARATADHTNLADALLADATSAAALAAAGITPSELESALEPESYLGATDEFIKRALTAHAHTEEVLRS
jgi:3-carboxy-cis,cis-muconate cycloisomerase